MNSYAEPRELQKGLYKCRNQSSVSFLIPNTEESFIDSWHLLWVQNSNLKLYSSRTNHSHLNQNLFWKVAQKKEYKVLLLLAIIYLPFSLNVSRIFLFLFEFWEISRKCDLTMKALVLLSSVRRNLFWL